MSDCAIITPVCTTPALWIERIVLYRDTRSAEIIRKITLTRGLNVIWGVSQDTTAQVVAPGVMTGHSVGKSTLCRLIRYALGEKTFGRQATTDGILHAFPNGAVGMTVHVNGTRWSVLRPIGVLKTSKAAVDTDIDALLAMPPEECDYARFTQALEQTFIHPLPGAATGKGNKFLWEHLLAWMSRDQEARYQKLNVWRSSRSDAKPPAPNLQDALLLIRMVLGLYSADEDVLAAQIGQWEAELKAVEERYAKLQQENTSRQAYHNEVLEDILRSDDRLQEAADSLFGVGGEIGNYIAKLHNSIAPLRARRGVIAEELAGLRVEKKHYTDLLDEIEAMIATAEETVERDGRDEKLSELEAVRGKKCRYAGNKPFNSCPFFLDYYQKFLDRFNIDRGLQDRRAHLAAAAQQQQLHEWIAAQPEFQQNIKALTAQIRKREQEDDTLEQEIIATTSLLQRIEHHQQERERLSAPVSEDDELHQLGEQVKSIRREIQEGDNSLRKIQTDQKRTGEELEGVFTRLIRLILSDQYAGEVVLPPDHDIDFRICETEAGLTGEAVETFAIVLADIAALLWSVAGNGHHPRFLLHDSPREADLDREIYNSFLRGMHCIATALGGDNAPFQYIVTTTTNPPAPLDSDGTVKLSLQAHPESALLLGQRIQGGVGLLTTAEETVADESSPEER